MSRKREAEGGEESVSEVCVPTPPPLKKKEKLLIAMFESQIGEKKTNVERK